jgi:small subunit ribosomal protein S2
MTTIPSMKELLEAGSHFGHEAKRWNPKMSQFIFTQRGGIHVIDLEITEKKLKEAVDFITSEVGSGAGIVFLATKRQAQEFTREQAERVGAMHMTTRWVGGLFTNFETVKKTLTRFKELTEQKENGTVNGFTKKEQLLMGRDLAKIEKVFGGVKTMEKLPEIIFVVDSKKELNAVLEARKMGVKIVAICDTNSDPTLVDYPIPANDDAIKSIQLIVKTIADAVEEGKQIVGKKKVEAAAESETDADQAVEEKPVKAKKAKAEKAEKEPVIASVAKQTEAGKPEKEAKKKTAASSSKTRTRSDKKEKEAK